MSAVPVLDQEPTPAPRRVTIHRAGSYDRLVIEPIEPPEPGPGEITIDVAAAGVNYADSMVRMGLYRSAKEFVGWPITPGFEVAGVVRAVGEGVQDLAVGTPVFAVTLFGGYTTTLTVKRSYVRPLPQGLSFAQAAAFPAVYLTAWYALHELAHPRPGARILIHSAAGGVGGALVQLAKRAGCHVTGVVGGAHKVEPCRDQGADHVIDKSSQDLWAEAERIAPDGFDIICDANGVSTLSDSYRHLRKSGKLVIYGFASMISKGQGRPSWVKLAVDYLRTPTFKPMELTMESKSVLAFNLSYLYDREDILDAALTDLSGWLDSGQITPPPVTEYPLDEVARAHQDIESGATTGKLVLTV